MQNQAPRTGSDPAISMDPVWLKSVMAASRPVRFSSGGLPGRLKRWIRRVVARAAWRGGAELFADQQVLNQAMVEALRDLTAAVRDLQTQHQKSMRLPTTPEGLQVELRTIREDLRSLQRRPVGDGLPVAPSSSPEPGSPGLDALYYAFEETFRGSEETIEARLEVYRPWVLKSLAGLPDPVWLDLGCGRGEWLRLLAKSGIVGIGVDSNQGMVAAAHASGLNVLVEDVVQHLRTRGAGTVDGLSAFHLVEHLPPELVLELLREGIRVVRPGGALILETPNPENLQVGAHTFYLDPTHRTPVPPAFLSFLARQAGWEQVDVMRLHADEGDLMRAREAWKGDPTLQQVANLVFGPRDYAVVARRPMEA